MSSTTTVNGAKYTYPKQKLGLWVGEDLYHRVKIQAAVSNQKINNLFIKALEREVSRLERKSEKTK